MDTEKNESPLAAFIRGIEAKIAALQNLLASVKAAAAVGALGEVPAALDGLMLNGGTATGETTTPTELPVGAFLGKSIPDCIRLYLSAAKRKKTIKEIASALREGGVESTSPNFEGVITGALNRMKSSGAVLRFKDGWGLPQWYPANMRAAATPTPSKRGKKKKSKGSKKAGASQTVQVAANKPLPTVDPGGVSESAEQRILGYFKRHPGKQVTAKDVTEQLEMRSQTVTFLLGKLAFKKRLEKSPEGLFRMASD